MKMVYLSETYHTYLVILLRVKELSYIDYFLSSAITKLTERDDGAAISVLAYQM
jgi:hypothetical protein